MRKIYFLLFVLLFLIGCKGGGSSGNDVEFFGTKGLEIAFSNVPDREVIVDRVDQKVLFEVIVSNHGRFPEQGGTPQGRLWLSGFDKSIVTFKETQRNSEFIQFTNSDQLQGRNSFSEEGGREYFLFEGVIKGENVPKGIYEPVVLAQVCYRYQTVAAPVVCVDKTPFEPALNPVCTATDVVLSSQAAPVAITKIEETVLGDDIQFKISLENKGDGQIIHPNSFTKCSPTGTLARDDIDKVKVTVEMNDQILACRSIDAEQDGITRLIDGKGFILCTIAQDAFSQDSEQAQRAFQTPIEITVDYAYKSSDKFPFTIRKVR